MNVPVLGRGVPLFVLPPSSRLSKTEGRFYTSFVASSGGRAFLTSGGDKCDALVSAFDVCSILAFYRPKADLSKIGIRNTSDGTFRIPITLIGAADEMQVPPAPDGRTVSSFDIGNNAADLWDIVSDNKTVQRISRQQLTFGDLQIWLAARVAVRGGKPVRLSKREMDLLIFLAKNAPNPVTRSQLLSEVFGLSFEPGTNVVEVHIHRLRQKLEAQSATPVLHTARGEGYFLSAEAA